MLIPQSVQISPLRLIDSALLGKYPGLIDSAWIYCPICCTLVSGSLHTHDIATGRLHNDIIFVVSWVKVLFFRRFHPVDFAFYVYRPVSVYGFSILCWTTLPVMPDLIFQLLHTSPCSVWCNNAFMSRLTVVIVHCPEFV